MALRVYALLLVTVLLSVSARRVKKVTKNSRLGTDAETQAKDKTSCPDVSAMVGIWNADKILSTKSGWTQHWTSSFERWIHSRRITISTTNYFDVNGEVGKMGIKAGTIAVNMAKEAEGNTAENPLPPKPRSNVFQMDCWCAESVLTCGKEMDLGNGLVRRNKYFYDYRNLKDEGQGRGLSLSLGFRGTDSLHVKEVSQWHWSDGNQKYGEFDSYFKRSSVDSEPDAKWVKLTDPNTEFAMPYWYLPSFGAIYGSEPPQQPEGTRRAQPKAPAGPPAESKEDTELAQATNVLLRQMVASKDESDAARKKAYHKMSLQWHPDKNADRLELATQVFQYIQQQKEWYLKDV